MFFFRNAALAFGLAAALLPFRPAAGQEGEAFTETFDVRVINLEAVVEDAAGNRVQGLAAEDFEILVDGKSHAPDYFSEIRDGQLPASSGSLPTLHGDTVGGRLPTSYLVFIDLLLSDPMQTAHAAEQLAGGLASLPPEDQVAVFAFDGKELFRLAGWHTPRQETIDILRSLKNRDTAATAALGSTSQFDARGHQIETGVLRESVVRRAQILGREMEAALTAAASAMRVAAPPPGRRVMLTLAGTWPTDFVAYWRAELVMDARLPVRNAFPKKAYERLYSTANRLGYTLYAIDLVNLRGFSGALTRRSWVPRPGFDLNGDRNFARDAGLERLAEETGGRAFTGGLETETLAKIREDVSSFYWLGFDATGKGDDKSHRIEVKVRKPGLAVRSRRQFSDISQKAELEQEVESYLLFDRDGRRQDFTVFTGMAAAGTSGNLRSMRLPVTLRIPLNEVTFEADGKKFRAELELRVAAIDVHGQRSEMPVIPVKLDGPVKPVPGQFATYETTLKLREGSRRCVLGLTDKKSGKLMVSTLSLY